MRVAASVSAVGGTERVAVEIDLVRSAAQLVLPRDVLERAGARPSGVSRFKRSGGRRVEASVGTVELTLDGQAHTVRCVYAEPRTTPAMGDAVLAPFGLVVDPSTGELAPLSSEILRTPGEGRAPGV